LVRRFCAICGKVESEAEPLIENLCWSCYRSRHRLIVAPRFLEVEVCSSCGSYRLGGKWLHPSGRGRPEVEAAIEAVRREVKLNGSGVIDVVPEAFLEKGNVRIRVVAHGTVHPLIPEYEEEAIVVVRIIKVSCPTCVRIASKYFIATLQIRAEGRRLTRNELTLLTRLIENTVFEEARTDRNSYIVEIEELDEGLNYKFASTRIARLIASKIKNATGAQVKETFKLIGVNRASGKRISRLTISVRLPPFTFGDVIKSGDTIIRFESYRSGKFMGIDLSTWKKASISYQDVWSGRVVRIASLNELPRAMVISIQRDVVQLMDSSTYRIFEVSKPNELSLNVGMEVRYLEVGNEIYIAGTE